MKRSIVELLDQGVVLLDGGVGSALIADGLPAGTPPEAWNLDRPEALRRVHAGHVAAGSDVIQTNTFGASPLGLARYGLESSLVALNRAAVRIAQSAAAGRCLVAGDIGPSGLLLPPVGAANADDLARGFARQAAVLADAGVDYLSIETMTDLAEALCALRAVRSATDLPVTVCMSFEHRKRGYFTLMGNGPEECVRSLFAAGAAAVGANCSLGSQDMVGLAPLLVVAGRGRPVIAKPNAGLPDLSGGELVYRQEPEAFARDLATMVAGGVRAVGGCCGTDDRFVAALRHALGATGNARLASSPVGRSAAPPTGGATGD